jgi:hypothetical protein
LAKIEEIAARVVGQPCTICVEWIEDAVEPAGTRIPAAAAMGQQRQLRAELLQIPLVKKAADVLNAQIIRADDGFGTAAEKSEAPTQEDSEPDV